MVNWQMFSVSALVSSSVHLLLSYKPPCTPLRLVLLLNIVSLAFGDTCRIGPILATTPLNLWWSASQTPAPVGVLLVAAVWLALQLY
jgi:hypothetical protein